MNNQYYLWVLGFSLFILLTVFLGNALKNPKEKKLKIKKQKKSFARGRVSATEVQKHFGGNLTKRINEKADVKTKYKVENLCLQAGYPLSYGEYKILGYGCGIASAFLIATVISNYYLAFLMIFVGQIIPHQIIKSKANSRIRKMEEQCGSFLQLVMERYKVSQSMSESLLSTLPDFIGCEPFYTCYQESMIPLSIGGTVLEALEELTRRTGNQYIARFKNYFEVSEDLSSHQKKVDILSSAQEQYKEDNEIKSKLKEKIQGAIMEGRILVAATPIFMVWQSITDDTYLTFMLHTQTGKLGIAFTVVVEILCIWFINTKIAAPLD